jgi:hypothetical protein
MDPPPTPTERLARIARLMEVTMNTAARTTVAFDKNVAVPRGPNAAWLPMPPNALPISVPRALCSKTARIRISATST